MSNIVNVGPLHPALHEPVELVLKVEDGVVVDVDVKLGHVYRAIELLATKKTWIQVPQLAERICGLCGGVQRRTFVAAVETLLEVDPPLRAKYVRTIVLELERIQSHLMAHATVFHALGMHREFVKTMAIREKVLELLELIAGSRRHVGLFVIGGVTRDIPDDVRVKVLNVITEIEKWTSSELKRTLQEDRTYLSKMRDVGRLSQDVVLENHLVGPVARASGVRTDIRFDEPYEAYPEVNWEVIICRDGDNWARMYVRALEIIESCSIIRQCLNKTPGGDIIHPKAKPWLKIPPKVPPGEVLSRSEAPRGEVVHYVKSDGSERPARWRVRVPTYANLAALKHMLRGLELDNVLPTYLTIDPCISCTNRVTVINTSTGITRVVSMNDLAPRYRIPQA